MSQWLAESARYLLGILIGFALVGLALVWAYARRLKGPTEPARTVAAGRRQERTEAKNEVIREVEAKRDEEKSHGFLEWSAGWWRSRRGAPGGGKPGAGE